MPGWAVGFYRRIEWWIPRHTRRKVKLLGSEFQTELLRVMDQNVMDAMLGAFAHRDDGGAALVAAPAGAAHHVSGKQTASVRTNGAAPTAAPACSTVAPSPSAPPAAAAPAASAGPPPIDVGVARVVPCMASGGSSARGELHVVNVAVNDGPSSPVRLRVP